MKILSLFLAVCIFFFTASATSAQYGPYEGPTPGVNILIDKLISVPRQEKGGAVTFDFVDNLGVNDHRFEAQDFLFFKIRVKNTSSRTLTNVVIKDFAPDFIEVFSDPGTLDETGKTLTITVGDLAPDQEKEYIVRARVREESALPADKAVVCLVNRAEATAQGAQDDDSTHFCVQKEGVKGVIEVPAAGPEYNVLLLAGVSLMGLVGARIRKISS